MKIALNNQILSNEKTTVTALDRAKLYLNNPIDVTTLTPSKIQKMLLEGPYQKYTFYVEVLNSDNEYIINLFGRAGSLSTKNQFVYTFNSGNSFGIVSFAYMRFSGSTPVPAGFSIGSSKENGAITLSGCTGNIFIGTL